MGRRWRLGHNPWQDDTSIKAHTMTTLRLISSMATKPLLADLVALYKAQMPDVQVLVESVGGVDAAKRVQAGEAFDGVVLASDAIDKLIASGHVLAGSRADLVRSGVAVAVPAGQPVPDISTEAALKTAILAAPTLGYSTGPSGVQLAKQFEVWGIAELIKDRIVQAKPGVPVGALVVRDGQVVASGTSQQLLADPQLAGHFGDDAGVLWQGQVQCHDDLYQLTRLQVAAGSLWVSRRQESHGDQLRLQIRARDVSVALSRSEDSSISNLLPATLVSISASSDPAHVQLLLDAAGAPLLARISRRSLALLGLKPGQALWAQIKAVALLA